MNPRGSAYFLFRAVYSFCRGAVNPNSMQEFYFVSIAGDLVPAEHCKQYGILPAFYDKIRFPAVDAFEKIRYLISVVDSDVDPHGSALIWLYPIPIRNPHPNPEARKLTKLTNKSEFQLFYVHK